ncbi:leucine-rich repeat-containing protein 75B [Protopterus annectens]|uniref:leucine-rich repeat-containing protein 75B n=1 Tax=Protopterus annectens TaxID=7888 RepID=UPI001CF97326|nr:leucine-rich repeat-containing protein 75B [Protopterus annectens]
MGARLSRQSSLDDEEHGGGAEEDVPHSRRDQHHPAQRAADGGVRSRRHFLFASLLLSPEKLPGMLWKSSPAPYVRRVGWIREIQALVREHKLERALRILSLLRKDLGLEGSPLDDVLYKHTAYLNLVDPITHDLLMCLTRDLQCPKKDSDPLKCSDKLCRQLIYHLTPHSKWHRQSMPRRKSQACLKSNLQKKLSNDSMDLSGMPLSTRDIHRVAYCLQNNKDSLITIDLSFTELTDEHLRMLLPFLSAMPKLANVALNGNRLTRTMVKDLTEIIKDITKFPSLSWLDVGNNLDIFTLPQPLLVGLRRRCSLQSTLPTIYESSNYEMESSDEEADLSEEDEEKEEEPWHSLKEKEDTQTYAQKCCER